MSTIDSLREALKFSPDNIPLRMHVAQVLFEALNYSDAVVEYKYVLSLDKNHIQAKCGLAKAAHASGDDSLAFVVLEDACLDSQCDAESLLLFAKMLYKDRRIDEAGKYYKQAIERNAMLSDAELDREFRQVTAGVSENTEGSQSEDEMSFLARKYSMERPELNFDNVGGMDKVKEEISMKIIHPLQHPDLYKAYGKKIGGGILLYGPPGCGKTYLARATAGQVNARFISVGIQDILDMWIGNSEKNLHSVFELARANTPCVLFFDEVDALAASRSDMRQSAGRQLINQFLQELDGVDSNNDGVLILAATNAPWNMDSAFRRPGRFDRIIFVSPPDNSARSSILKKMMAGKPQQDINFDEIASKCNEFSGADMKALVDVAIERKLTEVMKTGIPQPLVTKDLLKVVSDIKPSTKEWFIQAKNYALYANESGQYNDIMDYINKKR